MPAEARRYIFPRALCQPDDGCWSVSQTKAHRQECLCYARAMCWLAEGLPSFRLMLKVVFLLLSCACASVAHAQVDAVVCSAGNGSFETAFRTGVKVEVGAARHDGFAVRMCQGKLSWEKSSLVVAPSAFEVDIDALGVDLGLGVPVVTFQVKQAPEDCCSTLLIYSLQKPPKLLRTITGGGSYSTSDRNLNTNLEIWTSDAASMQGFEDSFFTKQGVAPAVVFRFVRGKLWDAGPEFQNLYDEAIANARSGLSSDDLRAFKESGGRLGGVAHFSAEEERQSQSLQRTKIRVLQIVWSYLYSGREQNAWEALGQMWPAEDFDRIKAEIIRARGHGMLAQVDGTSTQGRAPANTARIYDARSEAPPPVQPVGRRRAMAPTITTPMVIPPVPIFIAHLTSVDETEDDLPASEMVDLTIDAAGKVRAVRSADAAFEAKIKDDIGGWKFIPAMEDERPVASRIYLILSPKR